MSAATIIFTDIVGFSKKPTAQQRKLVDALNEQVSRTFGELIHPKSGSPSVIALPTGDGIALAFLHLSEQSWNRDALLKFIVRLHQWAHQADVTPGAVQLRVGVHLGAIEVITDINKRVNVCGGTINYTQRVMDAASPAQTLFSETAYTEYIANDGGIPVATEEGRVEVSFKGPIEVFAKHGVQIAVYKMVTPSAVPWHTNADPVAKHLMVVGLTDLPKDIQKWGVSLTTAKHVALIQLTGERLLPKLESGVVKLSDELKRIWVFMPAPDQARSLGLPIAEGSPEMIDTELVRRQTQRWHDFLTKLRREKPTLEIKLGVFFAPPYFGASFLDWDMPKGRIHVSPCVWGKPSTQWPGYDLEWLGSRPSEIYETYRKALDYLNVHTANTIN